MFMIFLILACNSMNFMILLTLALNNYILTMVMILAWNFKNFIIVLILSLTIWIFMISIPTWSSRMTQNSWFNCGATSFFSFHKTSAKYSPSSCCKTRKRIIFPAGEFEFIFWNFARDKLQFFWRACEPKKPKKEIIWVHSWKFWFSIRNQL